MPSLPAILLRTMFQLQCIFGQANQKLDIAKDREQGDKLAQTLKPIGQVEAQPVSADGVPSEWITPSEVVPGRVTLYLHGGGYVVGSSLGHRPLVGSFATVTKSRALSIDYRLAPEHRFPAAVDDALAAYRWLLSNGNKPENIIIAGDSAGGGLTLALLVKIRAEGLPLPACGVCLSPWVDLAGTGESQKTNAKADFMLSTQKLAIFASHYLNGTDPKNPLASPLYANLTGLPPLLIQVGGSEVLLDDGKRVAEKAKSAGVDVTLEVWPDMQHEWHFAASVVPEGRKALENVGNFVQKMM